MKLMRVMLFSLAFVALSHGAANRLEAESKESSEAAQKAQIWEINRPTVNAQKKVIKQYMQRNAKMRVAVRLTLATAVTAAVGYYLLRDTAPAVIPQGEPLKITQESFKNLQGTVGAVVVNQNVMLSEMQQMSARIDVLHGQPLPKVIPLPGDYGSLILQKAKGVAYGTYGLAKDLGTYFIQNLPATVAACIVNILILRDLPTLLETLNYVIVRPIKQINHVINVEWFLVSQLKVKKIYLSADKTEYRLAYEKFFDSSLARAISMLPLASDDFERGHYVNSIVTDLNLLSRQLSKFVAFCEIRTDHITPHNKVCGKHLKDISDYMFYLVQKFSREMAELLASRESHVKIPAAFQEFQFKLVEQIEAFRMYERAAYYDIIPSK